MERGSLLPHSGPEACFRLFGCSLLGAPAGWPDPTGGKPLHSSALRAGVNRQAGAQPDFFCMLTVSTMPTMAVSTGVSLQVEAMRAELP